MHFALAAVALLCLHPIFPTPVLLHQPAPSINSSRAKQQQAITTFQHQSVARLSYSDYLQNTQRYRSIVETTLHHGQPARAFRVRVQHQRRTTTIPQSDNAQPPLLNVETTSALRREYRRPIPVEARTETSAMDRKLCGDGRAIHFYCSDHRQSSMGKTFRVRRSTPFELMLAANAVNTLASSHCHSFRGPDAGRRSATVFCKSVVCFYWVSLSLLLCLLAVSLLLAVVVGWERRCQGMDGGKSDCVLAEMRCPSFFVDYRCT